MSSSPHLLQSDWQGLQGLPFLCLTVRWLRGSLQNRQCFSQDKLLNWNSFRALCWEFCHYLQFKHFPNFNYPYAILWFLAYFITCLVHNVCCCWPQFSPIYTFVVFVSLVAEWATELSQLGRVETRGSLIFSNHSPLCCVKSPCATGTVLHHDLGRFQTLSGILSY